MQSNEVWMEVVFGDKPERPEAVVFGPSAADEGAMLRKLSGTELKVLQALALHAMVLAHPQLPGGKEEFGYLLELGLVTEEDRGRLAASVSHGQIARETGLSRHTVGKCLRRLETLGVLRHHSLWRTPAHGRIWASLVVFDGQRVQEVLRRD